MRKGSLIYKYPVISFVVLTFLITHVLNPIIVEIVHILFPGFSFNFPASQLNERSLLAQYGGTIAAIFVTVRLYGWKGLQSVILLSRLSVVTIPWLFAGLLLPLVMIVLSFLLSGVGMNVLLMTLHDHWPFYLLIILGFVISAGLAEEFGWRGFLLPQLLKAMHPLMATFIVFVVLSLWHFPALLAGWKNEPILPWIILALAIAIIHSWLFFKSKGNLIVVIIFHASFDAQYSFYSQFIPNAEIANSPFHQGWAYITLYCILASALIVLTKGKLGYDHSILNSKGFYGEDRLNTVDHIIVENSTR
ncbi:CPBP family intramembrane glutamic endopeptidase [Chitinophaga deserti]|uniref:CPBP family intramembrane glutamic endopeptidase n=1 Tax=Chitinophaga deserti TaxID=2164099 RepID=UPI000D6CC69F|nr:type II CAAX endopeptidase family protein [Chitinophaga deserti]